MSNRSEYMSDSLSALECAVRANEMDESHQTRAHQLFLELSERMSVKQIKLLGDLVDIFNPVSRA